VGAYVFGSALELCRTDSDIDLGIFINPELDERQQLMLEGQIALQLEPLANHFLI
jgi:predicted nucleotidyltransferase